MIAERARVMLLEKAFLRASLRTADEADRAARGMREHERGDRGIIVGEVPLGRFRFGKDDAVAAANLHVAFRRGRGLFPFGGHVLPVGSAQGGARVCQYL